MIRELESLLEIKVDVVSDRGLRERFGDRDFERGGAFLRDDKERLLDILRHRKDRKIFLNRV